MPLPSTISDREARSATGPVALPDPASRWELEILTVVPWSGDDLLILVLVSVFFLTTGFSDQITNAVDRDSTRARETRQGSVQSFWSMGARPAQKTIRPPAAKFVDGLMAILGFLSLSRPAGFYYDQTCTTIPVTSPIRSQEQEEHPSENPKRSRTEA